MFKDFKFKLYSHLFNLLPFIISFFVVIFPGEVYELKPALLNYLIAFFLYVSWKAVRNLYIIIVSKKNVLWTHYVSLGLFALSTPLILQVLKSKLEINVFYIVMVVMLSMAVTDYYEYKSRPHFSIISKFIFFIFAGLQSFLLLMLPLSKEVIFYCFAISLVFLAQYLSKLANEKKIILDNLKAKIPERKWSILYSISLLLSVVIILGMSVYRLLPYTYALIVGTVPLIAPLINRLNLSDDKCLDLKAFFIETSGLSTLFIAIIILLKLL